MVTSIHQPSRLILTMLLAAIAIPGVTAESPEDLPAVSPELAVFYVYHQTESAWAKTAGVIGMRRVVIFVDDSKAVSLGQGNHTRIAVQPGPHKLTAKTKIFAMLSIAGTDIKIDAQAGETYYLHFFERNIGGGAVVSVFVAVDEAEGSKGVASTDFVAAKLE